MFYVGPGPLYSHVSLQCAVTDATNYDILVGQQALYPLGFGVDNWTEEAWIRPGWSAGDGRKELIPVAFASGAMTSAYDAMFGCSGLVADLPCGSTLFEETFAFMSGVAETHEHASVLSLTRHAKDPLPPWGTQWELTDRSQEIVATLDTPSALENSSTLLLARTIQWQPPDEGITLVKLFAGIDTGLATVLPVITSTVCWPYIPSSFHHQLSTVVLASCHEM